MSKNTIPPQFVDSPSSPKLAKREYMHVIITCKETKTWFRYSGFYLKQVYNSQSKGGSKPNQNFIQYSNYRVLDRFKYFLNLQKKKKKILLDDEKFDVDEKSLMKVIFRAHCHPPFFASSNIVFGFKRVSVCVTFDVNCIFAHIFE